MPMLKSFLFLFILGGLFLLRLILPAPSFLASERRPPATVPAPNWRGVSSGDFMERFDRAAADGFPFREQFRTLRAAAVLGAFLQTDKDGLYIDAYGIGEIKPADGDSVRQAAEKINAVSAKLRGANRYYSFIPDKSWYAEKKLPGFDAEAVKKVFTPEGTYIDLTTALSAESFYHTDLHWNQAELGKAVTALAEEMGFEAAYADAEVKTAGAFKGVYAGQMALPVDSAIGVDEMKYFDIPGLSALCLNAQSTAFEPRPVYDAAKLEGVDPYDFFLQGAQPLVVIENDNANTPRELFIFRDSFSSSLAPLLATGYARVTLIDLRYMDMTTVEKWVDFPQDCDVLFLYSSQILNRASVLL